MAKAAQPAKVSFWKRFGEIGTAISFVARRDRLFIPLAVASLAVPIAGGVVALLVGLGWIYLLVGVTVALLLGLTVLSLRIQPAMVNEAKGMPGAPLVIARTLGDKWRTRDTPIAYTTQEDMVHLVLGPPGVVLLGEGNPNRVRPLLAQEKRRLSKVIGSADMRDFIVGDGEGQLPLAKLRSTLNKLPRTLSGKEVSALDTRLTALTARPTMPRGAIPKNLRPPRGAFRMTRGR